MSEENYSKREVDMLISGITKHIDDTIREPLARIEQQTLRTNGRVTKCEDNISDLKTGTKVANWAFGITIPIILTMGVWIFFNQLEAIRTALNGHITTDKEKWDIVYKKLELK